MLLNTIKYMGGAGKLQANAISPIEYNEHPTAESEKPRARGTNFQEMFEKEKIRIGIPALLLNIQSLFNSIPTSFSDHKVGSIQNDPLQLDLKSKSSTAIYQSELKPSNSENNVQQASENKNGNISSQVKANELRSTNEKINNTFFINLSTMQEFQDILVQAKNRIPSIEETSIEELISSIIDKAKVIKENEKIELIIKLKPEHLGEIVVSLSKDKGNISIVMFADKNTKELMEQSLGDLEKTLKSSNLNISNLQVSINNQNRGTDPDKDDEHAYLGISSAENIMYNNRQPETRYVNKTEIEEFFGLDALKTIFSDA